MEGQNINSSPVYTPEQLSSSQSFYNFYLEPNPISNAFLENIISLKKTPFLIQEQESNLKRINSPETTCERMQQKIIHYNRKQKSLEELSRKFLNQFEGTNTKFLQLDKVTKELNVEKRRIYDIINILQSLKVVSKNGKNNYKWRGLSEAINTINECQKDIDSLQVQSIWKEKSLQFLASGLLKLFLHWKPILSLEEAAKEIIKEAEADSLRTKIRRLYDIINVFKSLKLVKKTTLPNKKPGFKWLGTDLLQEYIKLKSQGIEYDVDLLSGFKLEDDKPLTIPIIKGNFPKPKPQSFFIELLERKLDFPNVDAASFILTNQIWPQSRLPIEKQQKSRGIVS